MRVFLVAGEASGDLHAANLLRALRREEAGVEAFGVGGERLREAGLECVARSEELSVMGLAEVVRELPRLLRLSRRVRRGGAGAPPGRRGAGGLARLQPAARPPPEARRHPGRGLRLAAALGVARRPGAADSPRRAAGAVHPPVRGRVLRGARGRGRVRRPSPGGRAGAGDGGDAAARAPHALALLPGSRWHEVESLLPTMLAAAAGLRTEISGPARPSDRGAGPRAREARRAPGRRPGAGRGRHRGPPPRARRPAPRRSWPRARPRWSARCSASRWSSATACTRSPTRWRSVSCGCRTWRWSTSWRGSAS